ncbi:MAG: helix-turn-helix domain-containing protein, partial [Nitrososphaera sp.]
QEETSPAYPEMPLPFKLAKQHTVEKFERDYLTNCLKTTNGNITRAAQIARIDVKNFYLKIMKYDIDPQSFKKHTE